MELWSGVTIRSSQAGFILKILGHEFVELHWFSNSLARVVAVGNQRIICHFLVLLQHFRPLSERADGRHTNVKRVTFLYVRTIRLRCWMHSIRLPVVTMSLLLSKIRTLQPLRQHSKAVIKPPTPAPEMRTDMPFGSLRSNTFGSISDCSVAPSLAEHEFQHWNS